MYDNTILKSVTCDTTTDNTPTDCGSIIVPKSYGAVLFTVTNLKDEQGNVR